MCLFCKWFKKLCGSSCKCKCHAEKCDCHTEKGAEANKTATPITSNNQTNQASNNEVK